MKKYFQYICTIFLLLLNVSQLNAQTNNNVDSPTLWANVPAPLKQAKWVMPSTSTNEGGHSYDIVNLYAKFRHSFDISKVPTTAPLYITADQSYRLYVNGKFIANGPARGYQQSQPFDEIDIAKYLKSGKNLIAVRIYNAGRSTYSYLSQGYAGLLYALDLGNGETIVSSKSTKTLRQVGCDRDTIMLSSQMNNQEHIDLRIENPAWTQPDFDDSNWKKPRTLIYNAMPYYTFESRMIPMPEVYSLTPENLVATGVGKTISEDYRIRDVVDLFAKENLKTQFVNQEKTIATANASPKGEFKNFLFDFGKMLVGFPILKIEDAKGGEIVDIHLTELAKDGTGFDRSANNLRLAHRLICREGNQEHQFFQLSAFRYMTIRVRNNPRSDLKITPTIMWSAYPLGDKGKFKTSNKLVNDIWQACKQTQKICALDAYVDTPYREQAQWWGDARVQSWNTFFISGDARLLRRGIHSIAMQKTPNGLTYGHAPTMAHHCILPDFSLVWILTLWDYYWQTGEIDVYLNNRNTVKSILAYFDANTDSKTGLVNADPRYWLFLDWTNLQKQYQPSVLNLWLLEALSKMQKLCADNGIESDAKMYAEKEKKIRNAIEKNLLIDGLVSDGIMANGKPNPETPIHAQVLAKMTNLNGFNFEKAKEKILLPFLREEKTFKATPSAFWVVYLMQCMVDNGQAKEIYNFIKKNWKPFAEYGTTFEDYANSTRKGTSHSHAWSAHPSFMLPRILGGVKQEAPAWKKISINPNFFEDFVDITYPTPQGDIKVSWKKSATGKYVKKIKTPKKIEVLK